MNDKTANKAHTITPSFTHKFIGKLILEESQFAPTTFQAFEFIVASTSIANFQLIVNLFLIPMQCQSHITQLLREIEVYHLLLKNPSCSHWQLSTFNGWLLSLSKQTSRCRDQGLRRPLSPRCTTGSPSLLSHLMIPKHSFISAKVLQYFVKEIERTRTMQTIQKTMTLSFGRNQTYHRCSHWHQPYQPKWNWTYWLHWTHWLQQLYLAKSDSSASLASVALAL